MACFSAPARSVEGTSTINQSRFYVDTLCKSRARLMDVSASPISYERRVYVRYDGFECRKPELCIRFRPVFGAPGLSPFAYLPLRGLCQKFHLAQHPTSACTTRVSDTKSDLAPGRWLIQPERGTQDAFRSNGRRTTRSNSQIVIASLGKTNRLPAVIPRYTHVLWDSVG